MKHFTHQGIDGRWHAVYRIPGCDSLHSIGDSACQSGAQEMADQANANANAERNHHIESSDPCDVRIPKGFYTDEDAAC